MKTVLSVFETEDDAEWTALIDTASGANTFCFEASMDGVYWAPMNGRRIYGPGPKMGYIVTNAVAGGPAKFTGPVNGFRYLRVVQTVSDNSLVKATISTNKPRVMYIINEEMGLEDAFNAT